jgi:hypothetical protein
MEVVLRWWRWHDPGQPNQAKGGGAVCSRYGAEGGKHTHPPQGKHAHQRVKNMTRGTCCTRGCCTCILSPQGTRRACPHTHSEPCPRQLVGDRGQGGVGGQASEQVLCTAAQSQEHLAAPGPTREGAQQPTQHLDRPRPKGVPRGAGSSHPKQTHQRRRGGKGSGRMSRRAVDHREC